MDKLTWKKAFFGPWPFIWGGVLAGLVQAVYFWIYARPLDLTFVLAQAAAGLEERLGAGGALFSRGYEPGLSGALLGLLGGAALVAVTGRSRRTVSYPARVLAAAFAGGALAGFGAVLAEGDVLYHFVSGVAMMQISSLFITAFAIPFLFVALELLAVLGIAEAFQVDAGWAPASNSEAASHKGSAGTPGKAPLVWGAALLAVVVFLAAVSRQESPAVLVLGALLGIGIAKSGFGVEWSLLAPDAMASSPRLMRQLGLTSGTVEALRSYAALRAWLAAVGILSLTMLVRWMTQGFPLEMLAGATQGTGFHIGQVAGAPLLAMGSVLMLGAEFRAYARLGLGFTSSIAGMLGMLAGYIPGALWEGAITSWAQSNRISTRSWLPEVITTTSAVRLVFWCLFVGTIVAGYLLLRSEDISRKTVEAKLNNS